MKLLILFFLIVISVPGQKSRPQELDELKKLRAEFVKATEDYKASFSEAGPIYETNVTRAEEKLQVSRKLLAEGLISSSQVDENERQLAVARAKATDTKRQLSEADKQINEILDETKLAQELKRAKLIRNIFRLTPSRNSATTLVRTNLPVTVKHCFRF